MPLLLDALYLLALAALSPWLVAAGGEEVVLIARTGWGQDEDKARSKEAGFNFHIVKPVDPSALEKLLAGLLLTPA